MRRNWFPGFRPTALLLFAFIWFSTGWALFSRPDAPDSLHKLPLEYLPTWLRVVLWWVPAMCAVVAAFWPPSRDKWGWVLLSVPVSLRAASYGVAAFAGWIDFTYALSWLVILGILVLLASWPEPPGRREPE